MVQHPQVRFLGFLGRERGRLSEVGEQMVWSVLQSLQGCQALPASLNMRGNTPQIRPRYATDAEGFQLLNTRAGLPAVVCVHDLTSGFVVTAASGVRTSA
jgi:hypothetical protein